jgi:hypothetical protein
MFFSAKKVLEYPKDRGLYAFTEHRKGDFILFLKETSPEVLEFMHIPDRYVLFLTLEEFSKGTNDRLLDFVEQLPEDVFEVASANKIILEKTS